MRGQVQEWHQIQRALPASPVSVRLARMTARVACRAWRVPEAEETAALVASELVTVVLRHAEPGQLTLRVRMTPRRLRLEVRHPHGGLPADLGDPGTADATALTILTASTVRWGVAPTGSELWAEIAL